MIGPALKSAIHSLHDALVEQTDPQDIHDISKALSLCLAVQKNVHSQNEQFSNLTKRVG